MGIRTSGSSSAAHKAAQRRGEADAIGAQPRAVADPWPANRDRADAGHDLAFRQMPWRTSRCGLHRCAPRRGSRGTRPPRPRLLGPKGRAPLRSTSVNGSEKVDGWESFKTLLSVTAYHSFAGGRGAGSITPTIATLTLRAVTNFWPEARAEGLKTPLSRRRPKLSLTTVHRLEGSTGLGRSVQSVWRVTVGSRRQRRPTKLHQRSAKVTA